MPRTVDVEGFGLVDFDDAMTDEEIVYAIENDILKTSVVDQGIEFAKAIPRGFAGSFLSAAEGLAELADAGTNAIGLDDLIDSGDDNELVRLAREGRNAVNEGFLKSDVKYQDEWSTKFGEGLGSLASFFTPAGAVKLAGLAGKAASTTQLAGGLTLAGGAGAGDQAQRIQAARDAGIEVSEGEEDASIGLGTLVGFTEMAPVGRLLSRISKSAPKQVQDNIKSRLLSGLKSGGFEGLQEVTANIAQNAIERGIYNEDLAVNNSMADLLKSDEFTVGAASGFVADMVLTSIALRRGRYATQQQKDREGLERESKEERIVAGEQAVSDLQAREEQEAQQRNQEEQALDFQPEVAGIDPAQIDPPSPQQITKQLEIVNPLKGKDGTVPYATKRRNRYIDVVDSTNPEDVENYQAEERVRTTTVKGRQVETRYVIDVKPDGTTQEIKTSVNGVPNPNLQIQELAPQSEGLQANRKKAPALDHANHIYGVLGRSFPTAGKFEVDMPSAENPSVSPNQVVHVSPDGKRTPFGRNVNSIEDASILAGSLNEKILSNQVLNSVAQVINTAPDSYSPEVKRTLVEYGDTILHPDESLYSASEIDSAAGTTIAQGYQEGSRATDLVAEGVPARKLTASQKINARRVRDGLPETDKFTPAEAKAVLRGKFGLLIRRPETLRTAIYKTQKVVNKKTKKDEFVLVSENGDIITGRPPSSSTFNSAGQLVSKGEALEQLEAGKRRSKVKFATRYDAQKYASQLNKNLGIDPRDVVLENSDIDLSVIQGVRDLLTQVDYTASSDVVRDALARNNITNDIDSPAIRTLAENFTGVKASGSKKIDEMNKGELKALVQGIRSLPRFDSPTNLPVFKHNGYTSAEFGSALQFVRQNDNDTTNLVGIAESIGLDLMTDPAALKKAQDLSDALEAHIAPVKKVKTAVEPDLEIQSDQAPLMLPSPAPTVDINKLTAILKSRMNSFGLTDIPVRIDYALRNVARNAEGELVFGVRQSQYKDKVSGELAFDSEGKPIVGAVREDINQDPNSITEAFYSPDVKAIFMAVDTVVGIKDMSPEQQEAEFVRLLDHEMIHGMRQLDLWTEKEWQLLSSLAGTRKNRNKMTFLDAAKASYVGPVVQMEEAIAEMTREARADPKIVTGKPRTLLKRITDFYTKSVSAINGFGFNSFDSIIQGIESGEIGSRSRGQIRTLLETERQQGVPFFNAEQALRAGIAQTDQPEEGDVKRPFKQAISDSEGLDETISEADTQAQMNFVVTDIMESRTTPDLDVPATSVLQFAPWEPALQAATDYTQQSGIDYMPPDRHVLANPERGAEIADEYELMDHAPNDPLVQEAYQALVDETLAQYDYLLQTGLQVELMGKEDPYDGKPSNAIKDIKKNNHLYVFPTTEGYGPSDQNFEDLSVSEFPLLAETQYRDINGVPLLANDVFRAVHDFYGHVKSGTTFRATGEENAWQNHAAMYSPLARRAMTTETRGQNSWVNFGEFGESNRTAQLEQTKFAVQKTGLMPIWTSEENRISADVRRRRFESSIGDASSGLTGAVDGNGRVELTHYASKELQRGDPNRWGSNLSRNTAGEKQRISTAPPRTYFGIESGVQNGYRKEQGLGRFKHTAEVDASLLYDYNNDPEGFYKGTPLQRSRDYTGYENKIKNAGYTGYYVDGFNGLTVAAFDPLVMESEEVSSKEDAIKNAGLDKGFNPKVEGKIIPEGAIEKAVEKNIEKARNTPNMLTPVVNPESNPRAQYIAENPNDGLTLSDPEILSSLRRQPEYSPRAKAALDQTVTAAPTAPASRAYLDVTNTGAIGEFFVRAKAKAINRYARLEQIYNDPDLGFRDVLADSSAFAAALFADRSKGITAETIKSGFVSYKNGITKVEKFIHKNREYRGLIDVMSPLYQNKYGVDLEKLAQGYAIAIRSKRLREEKGLATPADGDTLDALMPEINKYKDENGNNIIEEWFSTWQAYNSKTVEFLLDTGVLDAETAKTWMDQADYVPFYRQAEDPNTPDKMPAIFKGMTSAATFKELKGGDTAVTVPLLDAITRNLDAAIGMGMRNVAQQRIVRDMKSLGLAREVIAGQQGNNIISFRVNGKKRDFAIDDPLMFESMQLMGGGSMETMLTSVVGAPSRVLREMITRDPGFMMVNMLRDTLSTYVTSGSDFVPVWSTLKNATTGVEALSKYGVVGGYDFGNDPDNVFKDFEKEMAKRGDGSVRNIAFRLWDYLGEATTASDAATRKAVYDDVLARTGNEAEAAFQALEVINFSRRGNSPLARVVTAAIPFLNARFQGLDVFVRSARGNYGTNKDLSKSKQAQIVALRGAMLASLTAMYFLMVSDDEQYKNADEHTRDNNWLLPTPWGVPFKVPIPFEIGLIFKTFPEKALAVATGEATGREALKSAITATTGTLGINPLGAQITKPLLEAYMNHNFFTGNPIVSKYLDGDMEAAFIDRDSTNRAATEIGQALGINPLKLEHVMKGYTGTIGSYVLDIVDSSLRSTALSGDPSIQMPNRPVTEYPIIKRFFARNNNSGQKEDFYELHKEIRKITSTLNDLKKKGRIDEYKRYLEGREVLLGLKGNVNYVANQLTYIRNQKSKVMKSDLSPERKKEVTDELIAKEKHVLKVTSVLKRKADLPVFDTLYR